MTATSYNGFSVGTRADLDIKSYVVPGTDVHLALRPVAAPLLLHIGQQIDLRVADIDESKGHREPDDWGYAYRETRGASTWSNHASGTATDFNATQWPRGVSRMTKKQIAECRQIRDEINQAAGKVIIQWGGDYQHSPLDQMHWELAKGCTHGDITKALAALADGGQAPKLNARPPVLWMHGPKKPHWTRVLQKRLGVTPVDGVFGKITRRHLIAYRKHHKLGRPRAVAGAKVWRKMGVIK